MSLGWGVGCCPPVKGALRIAIGVGCGELLAWGVVLGVGCRVLLAWGCVVRCGELLVWRVVLGVGCGVLFAWELRPLGLPLG